ncbi:unnamed protein product [Lactuca virosa]|uniref:DNA replication factor RFC1 C-terminal domain-containing protein n=1 Tax=Lactuca virosa TaxID=75947 RepID=A0AAU9MQQ5_9ASTR|nr:unnamed protein product [Lactuca virosa]
MLSTPFSVYSSSSHPDFHSPFLLSTNPKLPPPPPPPPSITSSATTITAYRSRPPHYRCQYASWKFTNSFVELVLLGIVLKIFLIVLPSTIMVISIQRGSTLCLDYLSLVLKHMTDPLKTLPKGEGFEKVVEFMDAYSISQEDFESLMLMSKFQGMPNLPEGVQPTVKFALTMAYNKGSKTRVIRTTYLITLPGIKSFLQDDL